MVTQVVNIVSSIFSFNSHDAMKDKGLRKHPAAAASAYTCGVPSVILVQHQLQVLINNDTVDFVGFIGIFRPYH